MTQIINKSFLIMLFLIISNCGDKVVNNLERNNFNIKEINTSGDKRISFKIKNSLMIDSLENRTNNLILEMDPKKIKKIKEKILRMKLKSTKYC